MHLAHGFPGRASGLFFSGLFRWFQCTGEEDRFYLGPINWAVRIDLTCTDANRNATNNSAALYHHRHPSIVAPSMWASASNGLRILRSCASLSTITGTTAATATIASLLLTGSIPPALMEKTNNGSSSASALPRSGDGGRGRGSEKREDRHPHKGGGPGKDKIDALGRLLTRILRHMASELNLDMRSEAVRKDNKQRFSLMEENGELFIRANQGHTLETIESENLLKPVLSAQEVPVCVHGTYKKNLESILLSGLKRMKRLHVHFSSGLPMDGNVISGMRRDVNVLIFLDVRKALEDGIKLYISDNKVILTGGFDGVLPVKYFQKIETWPDRHPIPF